MTKWEHAAFPIPIDEIITSVNKLGAMGWQMVYVWHSYENEAGKKVIVVWFKREIDE